MTRRDPLNKSDVRREGFDLKVGWPNAFRDLKKKKKKIKRKAIKFTFAKLKKIIKMHTENSKTRRQTV